jgi:hypothetical protein
MRRAIFTALAAGIFGTASLLSGQAEAQQYMMPGPVEAYPPGYPGQVEIYPRVEVDPMATGSIVLMPQQMGQQPGETWIGYCSRRYPTYNRTSNTYLGPDGQRYLCQ